ncbi:acyl carrier protein [Microbacterium sp. QXD-8]|uniref:Acyl carrier protein n=1 Tax=Microbacterium psychrotolerans TaxID=3068321 RepID=A0ABU0Z177_9MICO|nr:acyl carrier protein [Microbacterium sp. QXD-8]MDQ7878333.1 acyl carrier protein [Microbacterium sp. QXD-8]
MPAQLTATEIEQWLAGRVVAYGKMQADDFTVDTPLAELGLDSVYALTLCGDIEDEFELEVDPTIVWDHPTIRELAEGIRQRVDE